MKDNYKSKAKNLTDAICRSLPHLDKRYMKPGDFPGLEFWVQPGGSKSWAYQYRIKGVKNPIRKALGTYPTIGVVQATNRAKKISTEIYEGIDPRSVEKVELLDKKIDVAVHALKDMPSEETKGLLTVGNTRLL